MRKIQQILGNDYLTLLEMAVTQRSTMMRNVVIPSCCLLPFCEGTVWLQNEDEATYFCEGKGYV